MCSAATWRGTDLRRAVTARRSPSGRPGVLALAALLLAACGEAGEETTTTVPPTIAAPTTAVPSTTLPVAAPLVVEGPGSYDGELVSGGLVRHFVLVVP